MKHETTRVAGVLFVLVPLFVIGGFYIGGYFLLSNSVDVIIVKQWRARYFASQWEVRVYRPAAQVEALLIGKEVRLSAAPREPANMASAPSTAN
jgi:hypothetical protein